MNLDISKPFDVTWLKSPLTFAFGAEWRGDKFNQSPGELASFVDGDGPLINTPPGAQVFPGFKPEDAGKHSRDSHALYVDAEANLTESSPPTSPRVTRTTATWLDDIRKTVGALCLYRRSGVAR